MRNRKRIRYDLRGVLERTAAELEQVERVAEQLGCAPAAPRAELSAEIVMQEIAPGVFASPRPSSTPRRLSQHARSALALGAELERRLNALRGRP